MDLDLDTYRDDAELFCEELDGEYYLHLSGRKQSLEIEAIYERHAELFSRDAVEGLREAWDRSADGGDRRRARHLLQFGFDGYLGQATRAEAATLAELEASLEVEVDGSAIPYRGVAVEQANEPDPE
ncbi:MAG: hypothetical protein ACRDL3_02050, partial [Solirubrobacterales bacterium]